MVKCRSAGANLVRTGARGARHYASPGLRGRHRGRRPSAADPGHAGEARSRLTTTNRILRRGRRRRRHRRAGRRLARARARADASACSTAARSAAATSHVAAGMLAPVSEADAGERALLALRLESARRWPAFAAELRDLTGIDVGLPRSGIAARGPRPRRGRGARARARACARGSACAPSACCPRGAAPGAGAGPDAAARARRPRRPRGRPAARRAPRSRRGRAPRGVVLRPGAEVEQRDRRRRRVAGVALAGGERIAAGAVVVAAGPWAGALAGHPGGARVPVRPVKGQLAAPARPGRRPACSSASCASTAATSSRARDGRYVLGATTEERGFDTAVTARRRSTSCCATPPSWCPACSSSRSRS